MPFLLNGLACTLYFNPYLFMFIQDRLNTFMSEFKAWALVSPYLLVLKFGIFIGETLTSCLSFHWPHMDRLFISLHL